MQKELFNEGIKPKGLEMYFDRKIAKNFADREQNEKNFRTAAIVDRVIDHEIRTLEDPLNVAELGGGAHPDRYHKLFERLLKKPEGHIDWVDISPFMIELAPDYLTGKYKDRKRIISFLIDDMIDYLDKKPDEFLDLAIMKYTLNYLSDLEPLFKELNKKLKNNGRLVASVSSLSPELRSVSSNARYFYKGEEFPEDETRTLEDGEKYVVKFLKEMGNPAGGYLEGAETSTFYHASETIKRLADENNFECFLGDWKEIISEEERGKENMDMSILVLRKK